MKYSGIRSIAKNAAYLLAARGLTYVVRAVYVVALARYLGPEVYGLFAYGQAWYLAFLPLTALGLEVILSREVGRDRERGARVVAQTLALRIVAVVVTAAACGLAGWFANAEPAARQLLLIFSLALAGRGLAVWTEQTFTAYEVSRYALRQEAVFRPFEVVLGLGMLVAGAGAAGVAAVHALVWWLQALRGMALVHRRLVPVRPNWTWGGLARLLVQGLPLGLSLLFSSWLLLGPLVLFRHVAGTEAAWGNSRSPCRSWRWCAPFRGRSALPRFPCSAAPPRARTVRSSGSRTECFGSGCCSGRRPASRAWRSAPGWWRRSSGAAMDRPGSFLDRRCGCWFP